MQTLAEYLTERVCIRVVRVEPNDKMVFERNPDVHTISIPLSNLERGATFETVRNYLLHYTSPKEYCSLSPKDEECGEVFVQLLWNK